MHRRLAELAAYAEAQRRVLLAAVNAVPQARREQRADPECWSVAEVLEHLHRVERGILRLAEHGVTQATAHAIGPERSEESLLGALDRFQLARRGGRIPAPERVVPTGQYTAAQMLDKLSESRRALLACFPALDGFALGEITFPHPLLGPLDFYQWLLFLGQHEARHAAQIQEIAARFADASQPDPR